MIGPCVAMVARLYFIFKSLSPVSHQEPFLVGVFFLRVHKGHFLGRALTDLSKLYSMACPHWVAHLGGASSCQNAVGLIPGTYLVAGLISSQCT